MLTYSFGSDHLVYWLMNISLFELRVRHHWNGSAALSAESVAVELGPAYCQSESWTRIARVTTSSCAFSDSDPTVFSDKTIAL